MSPYVKAVAKALHSASEVLYKDETVSSALSKISEVRTWVEDQIVKSVSLHVDRLAQELLNAGAGAPSEDLVSRWTAQVSELTTQLPTADVGFQAFKVPGTEDSGIDLSEYFVNTRELLTSLALLAKIDSKSSAFQDSSPEDEIAVVKKFVLSVQPSSVDGCVMVSKYLNLFKERAWSCKIEAFCSSLCEWKEAEHFRLCTQGIATASDFQASSWIDAVEPKSLVAEEADTKQCTKQLEGTARFFLTHRASIGPECIKSLEEERVLNDPHEGAPLNLMIPLMVMWHRIRQCKALVVEAKNLDLESWLSTFEMLLDMRATLRSDQCLLKTQLWSRAEALVQICEQALQQITSHADANLRLLMDKIDEAVKRCEAVAEAEPFPDTLSACASERILKKRASALFQTYAAAKATDHLYETFNTMKSLKDKMDAMQEHPLLQGRTESQSEVLTEISSRMEAARSKAGKLETLVLTLLSMVALWRGLKPMETRSALVAAALKTLDERGMRGSKEDNDIDVRKVPEPLVSLLVQTSQGGKAYHSA